VQEGGILGSSLADGTCIEGLVGQVLILLDVLVHETSLEHITKTPSLLVSSILPLLCRFVACPRAARHHRAVKRVLRGAYPSRAEYHAACDDAIIKKELSALAAIVPCQLDASSSPSPSPTPASQSTKSASVIDAQSKSMQSCKLDAQASALSATSALKRLWALSSKRNVSWKRKCLASAGEKRGAVNLILDLIQGLPEVAMPAALSLLAAGLAPHGHKLAGMMEMLAPEGTPAKSKNAEAISTRQKLGMMRRDATRGTGEEHDSDSAESLGDEGAPQIKHSKGEDDDVDRENVQVLVASVRAHPKWEWLVTELALGSAKQVIRSGACEFIKMMWQGGSEQSRVDIIKVILPLMEKIPSLGGRAKDLLSLILSISGDMSNPELSSSLALICSCLSRLLLQQIGVIAQHPNACIYQKLHRLYEVDGFYLESEPCLTCNQHDAPLAMHKVEALKAEIRFTDSAQLVRMINAQTIHRVSLNLSEVRRIQPIRSINVYISNKAVADVAELRGRTAMWTKVATVLPSSDQAEWWVDLALPVTAINLMFEFVTSTDVAAGERMLCPRCNRAVTDRHGVCRHCRENAFQCRLCRNINYEKLDAFLCNECGYCKHARLDWSLLCRPSFAVETIADDADKAKALAAIQRESENAHKCFLEIASCKRTLEQLLTPLALSDAQSAGAPGSSSLGAGAGAGAGSAGGIIQRQVQVAGTLYCKDAKRWFQSMMHSVRMLSALGQQLASYLGVDSEQQSTTTAADKSSSSSSSSSSSKARCFGCATKFLGLAFEVLVPLAERDECRSEMIKGGTLDALVESAMHMGPMYSREMARSLVVALARDSKELTARVVVLVRRKVSACLAHPLSIDIQAAVEGELALLCDMCSSMDTCWEIKYRALIEVLMEAHHAGFHITAVAEGVMLPCLRLLCQVCAVPRGRSPAAGHKSVALTCKEWVAGSGGFEDWKGMEEEERRKRSLARKYGSRWLTIVRLKKTGGSGGGLSEQWLKLLLLNRSSAGVRAAARELVTVLAEASHDRALSTLRLLSTMLSDVSFADHDRMGLVDLILSLTNSDERKRFLAATGFLEQLVGLVTDEVGRILGMEASCSADVSQGRSLKTLLGLLGSLIQVRQIRNRLKASVLLVKALLDNLFSLQSLLIQRTKLTLDCASDLMSILQDMAAESEEDNRLICLACIDALVLSRVPTLLPQIPRSNFHFASHLSSTHLSSRPTSTV
jgi:E3 ubiquitin-protein ligase UBR4